MKCKFKKIDGSNCKNNSLLKDKFCFWHSKKIPEDVKQKSRSNGGKKKIIRVTGEFREFELKTIKDVLDLNSSMINRVLKNKLDLRIATGLGYMLNLQIKAIEVGELEKRLEETENKVTKIVVKLPESFENHNYN